MCGRGSSIQSLVYESQVYVSDTIMQFVITLCDGWMVAHQGELYHYNIIQHNDDQIQWDPVWW